MAMFTFEETKCTFTTVPARGSSAALKCQTEVCCSWKRTCPAHQSRGQSPARFSVRAGRRLLSPRIPLSFGKVVSTCSTWLNFSPCRTGLMTPVLEDILIAFDMILHQFEKGHSKKEQFK